LLGGSSCINFMAYTRPPKSDLNEWSQVLGLKGWSYDELAPYYVKSQVLEDGTSRIHDPNVIPLDLSVHGKNGAVHTTVNPFEFPIDKSLMPALDEISGLPRPKDPWNGSHLGFYRSLFTVDRTGMPHRSHAALGYILPILDRPNLKILTETMALRLIIDESNVAKGVEIRHGDSTHQVLAKKEVILSAGAIQSPQLLELSGIGSPDVLKAAGIECRVPLPGVGENLQDHPLMPMVYELADGVQSVDSVFADPALAQEHGRLLVQDGGGAFAGFMSILGFVPYASVSSEDELNQTVAKIRDAHVTQTQKLQNELIAERVRNPQSPSINFVGAPATFGAMQGGHGNQSLLTTGAPPGRNACYSVLISDMYVASRGSVHIRSSDPLEPPKVDLGFLSNPADVEVFAAGARFVDRVFKTSHLKDKIKARFNPAPEVDLADPNQAHRYVNENILTYNHSACTCAMGEVVDERLHVKGVKGLRLVDASVFPTQISANSMATVYAIAEKAADMIKQDLGM
jgi:choline dehydrogenase-like flavoprotein